MEREAAAARRVLRGAVLFTPGDRPDRFDKGWTASEGRLILDLEDAVSPGRKADARADVARWVRESGCEPLVRLNPRDSAFFADDGAAIATLRVAGLVVPKVGHPRELEAARAAAPGVALYPLVETPEGLENAVAIASAPGVSQLMLGGLDLHAECGIAFPHPALMQHARLRLVLASRIARIAPPIDSPCPGVREPECLAKDAREAASLGFAGKLCIHPGQVELVNSAFKPSDQEVAWAREVIAAFEDSRGAGAIQVRGRMVDAPVVASAREILARLA